MLATRARAAIGIGDADTTEPLDPWMNWGPSDVLLITYGDSIRGEDEAPLATLARFHGDHLRDAVSMIHVLPFCPSSSDGGFAVVDYLTVDEDLGNWEDIATLGEQATLMGDLVLNHTSSQSEWFTQFTEGSAPGRDYFVTESPDADLSAVVRPRTHPLLRPTETSDGLRHVWCTFSHDQCDLDFSNPEVLLEFLTIIDAHLRAGVRVIRLDAVAYLWKRPGTRCIHLPETHLVIRLLRALLALRCTDARVITETNVPNRENLTYFGNGQEAHAIYNFSLPPLLLDALVQGRSEHLQTWMMSMPPAPVGTAYLNFMASHDGIGLRPAEGILSAAEVDALANVVRGRGGWVSTYASADGERPYELNVSLFDALAADDGLDVERFLCAHAIVLALEGVPAFYIHSLLATPNDAEAVARTGQARSINRSKLTLSEVNDLLTDPDSGRGRVFRELTTLMALRRQQPAFHPNATQFTLSLGPSLFGFWRQSLDRTQSIFAIHNVTSETVDLPLAELNLIATDSWYELISGEVVVDLAGTLRLPPYACAWLSNPESQAALSASTAATISS